MNGERGLATDVGGPSCPCGLTGTHSDDLHDQHARIITDACADAWDEGYEVGWQNACSITTGIDKPVNDGNPHKSPGQDGTS